MTPRIFMSVGAVVLIASTTILLTHRRSRPGELVAKEPALVWNGPSDYEQFVKQGGRATIRFELFNPGSEPVEVFSTQSSCGCAQPIVSPNLVPPGGKAVVAVSALAPAVGQKIAYIIVNTNSKISPRLDLQLKIISNRKPPFVIDAYADLNYIGDPAREAPREVAVATSEPSAPSRTPVLKSDLPFLRFALKRQSAKKYPDNIYFEKKYIYEVLFDSRELPESFVGEVAVVDPWDDRLVKRINVFGKKQAKVTVAPGRLVIPFDGATGTGSSFLLLLAELDVSDVSLAPEAAETGPLEVELVSKETRNKMIYKYRVSIKKSKTHVDKIYNIEVRSQSLPGGKLVVPVSLRQEAR